MHKGHPFPFPDDDDVVLIPPSPHYASRRHVSCDDAFRDHAFRGDAFADRLPVVQVLLLLSLLLSPRLPTTTF